MQKYLTSERLVCELVGLSRAAYRYIPLPKDDEELKSSAWRAPLAGMDIGLLLG